MSFVSRRKSLNADVPYSSAARLYNGCQTDFDPENFKMFEQILSRGRGHIEGADTVFVRRKS